MCVGGGEQRGAEGGGSGGWDGETPTEHRGLGNPPPWLRAPDPVCPRLEMERQFNPHQLDLGQVTCLLWMSTPICRMGPTATPGG